MIQRLEKAIQRLKQSNTYLTRKNARKEFNRAIKELQQMVEAMWPNLRRDGTQVTKTPMKGYSCPYCRTPLRSIQVLVKHLRHKHGWGNKCVCGKGRTRYDQVGRIVPDKFLTRHLAKQKDLTVHIVGATLQNSQPKETQQLSFKSLLLALTPPGTSVIQSGP